MLNKSKSNYHTCCLLLWKTRASREQEPEDWEGGEWASRTIRGANLSPSLCLNRVGGAPARGLLTCRDASSLSRRQLLPSPQVCTNNFAYNSGYSWTHQNSRIPLSHSPLSGSTSQCVHGRTTQVSLIEGAKCVIHIVTGSR